MDAVPLAAMQPGVSAAPAVLRAKSVLCATLPVEQNSPFCRITGDLIPENFSTYNLESSKMRLSTTVFRN